MESAYNGRRLAQHHTPTHLGHVSIGYIAAIVGRIELAVRMKVQMVAIPKTRGKDFNAGSGHEIPIVLAIILQAAIVIRTAQICDKNCCGQSVFLL
jgi:hypothetical protein